jgi:ATP-binding cassette, subfamily C, bacterial CydCD
MSPPSRPATEAGRPDRASGSRERRGAIDPRLLRHARATRPFLWLAVALGVVSTALVIAQAWLLADAVTQAFRGGRDLGALGGLVVALLLVVIGRAAVSWGTEVVAFRASATVKQQLRAALLRRVAEGGPGVRDQIGSADLAILATRGLDALDGYFGRYLPQLVLAVSVPVAIVAVMLGADWVSAAIVAVTVPLVPLFMALIGLVTRDRTDRQLVALQRLGGHFLDVVAGLPTLKIFGRARAQAVAIREVSDRYRRRTVATLRLAFLSSLVLELVATLSVALVAVAIGLRLSAGHLDLRTALFVLVLAPEAYLPLRQLGASFHESSEGLSAAAQAFDVIDRPSPPPRSGGPAPDPSRAPIEVDELSVVYPGRPTPALSGASLRVEPGEVVALTGPSGCGKSTLLAAMLGLVTPASGRIRVGGRDLAEVDADQWRSRIAWIPQRPRLFAASIADNVRLGRPDATGDELCRAVEEAGLGPVVARLPHGLETRLGDGGAGLSVGERRRLALARAILRDAPLLLFDEPTADLDGETEDLVLSSLRRLSEGRTVLLVAHRPALVALADRVVRLEALQAA